MNFIIIEIRSDTNLISQYGIAIQNL